MTELVEKADLLMRELLSASGSINEELGSMEVSKQKQQRCVAALYSIELRLKDEYDLSFLDEIEKIMRQKHLRDYFDVYKQTKSN